MNTKYQKTKKKRMSLGLCVKCGKNPPENGRINCRPCMNYIKQSSIKFRKLYPQKHRDAQRNRYLRHKPKMMEKQRIDNLEAKKCVVHHYGGKCACCGESNLFFLCVDHINNDGNIHRKSVPGGSKFYHWIIKNNFPDYLQILCYNCNNGKRFNGTCPHKYSVPA